MKITLLLISMLVFSVSCGLEETAEEDTREIAADNSRPEIEIIIENGLEDSHVYEIWVDPSDEPWSENLIEDILAPGDEFILVVSETTSYDIQIIDEYGESYTLLNQTVDEDGYSWKVTEDDSDWNTGASATVTVENELYNQSIWYIYATLSSSDDWGIDLLDYIVLEPNESFSFEVESGNYYDFYARNGDSDFFFSLDNYIGNNGYTWEISSLDLDNTLYEDETHGATAPVSLINRLGNASILYAFEDESGGEYWGDDLLEGDVLESAEEFTFYLRADRFYDFQVEDERGNTYTLWEVAVKDNGIFWEIIQDNIDE
ncbi:MAG: hypothetical protein KAH54_08325 [Candidatus Sabulitectum sp.]|nr:hypothetical protein [Candidatus Sabulitectum sp.]